LPDFKGCGKKVGYSLNQEKIEQEKKFDGIFILLSSRYDLKPYEVVESYKNLKEVEMLFDDLKNFMDKDAAPSHSWTQTRRHQKTAFANPTKPCKTRGHFMGKNTIKLFVVNNLLSCWYRQ